jgi:hypothetical protein
MLVVAVIFKVIAHLSDKDDAQSANGPFVGGYSRVRDLGGGGVEGESVINDGEQQLIAADFRSKCHGIGM